MHRIQRLVGIQTEAAAAGPRRVMRALGTLLAAGTIGATALGLAHDPHPTPQEQRVHVNFARPLPTGVQERAADRRHAPVAELLLNLAHVRGEAPHAAQSDESELMRVIERIHERLHAVREHAGRLHEVGERLHQHQADVSHERHVDRRIDRNVDDVELHENIVRRLHERLQRGGVLREEITDRLRDHLLDREISAATIDRADLHEWLTEALHDPSRVFEIRRIRPGERFRIGRHLEERKLGSAELHESLLEASDLTSGNLTLGRTNLRRTILDALDRATGESNVDRSVLHETILDALHDRLKDRELDVQRAEQRDVHERTSERLWNRLRLELPGHEIDAGALRLDILQQVKDQLRKIEDLRLDLVLPKLELEQEHGEHRHLELVQERVEPTEQIELFRTLLH